MSTSKHPSQKRYPRELRERALRMIEEAVAENGGDRFRVVTRVARQLGIGTESLRNWVRQTEIDGGQRPGVSSEEHQCMVTLEREVRELRRGQVRFQVLMAATVANLTLIAGQQGNWSQPGRTFAAADLASRAAHLIARAIRNPVAACMRWVTAGGHRSSLPPPLYPATVESAYSRQAL